MKDFVVPAKSVCQPGAIAVMSRRSCFAVIVEMSGRASANTPSMVMNRSSKAGPACSSVATSASANSIAACTNAKRSAIGRIRRLRIAQGPPMSLRIVHVAKRHWMRYPTRLERRARTAYRAVRDLAVRHYHAVICASRSATQAVVETADRTSSSNADVVALRQTHSVTRVRMKRLSVCVFVERY